MSLDLDDQAKTPASAASPKPTFGQRRIVFALAFCYVVSFLDRALVSVAGAPIKHDLGLSDSQFGAVHGTAFALLFSLCGLPMGWLADRADRRLIIAGGLVFWTAMTAASGLTQTYGAFFLARIGVGFGEACLVPAGMSLLGSVVPKARMARAVAVFLMGSTAGSIIALLGGGYLLGRLGAEGPLALPLLGVMAPWRMLFLLACPPGLIAAALLMTFREPPRTGDLAGSEHSPKAALAHLIRYRRAYGLLTAATAFSVTLAQAQSAWTPMFFIRRFGISAGDSAQLVGLVFLVSAPAGQWIGGSMIDRLAAKGLAGAPHLVLALCGALCLPAAMVFCLSPNPPVVVCAYAAFNFLAFAATPAGLTGWQGLTPERYRGLIVAGLTGVVTLVGVGLGPLLVGVLDDRVFHSEGAVGLSLLTVLAVAGLGGCAFALAGRKSFSLAQAD